MHCDQRIRTISWEFVRRASGRFMFDLRDILATLVGIGASALLFLAISPRVDPGNQ